MISKPSVPSSRSFFSREDEPLPEDPLPDEPPPEEPPPPDDGPRLEDEPPPDEGPDVATAPAPAAIVEIAVVAAINVRRPPTSKFEPTGTYIDLGFECIFDVRRCITDCFNKRGLLFRC